MHDLKIVITARIVQILTAFLTLRVMTTQLIPEEMGKTAIIIAITMFFTLIFVSPVGNYINRQLNTWKAKGIIVKRFLQAGSYFVGVACIAVISILVGYDYFTSAWHITAVSLLVLVSGFVVIKSMSMSLVTALNILGKRRHWAIFTILTLWIGLSASWYLTRIHATAEFWLLGQIIAYIIVACLAFYSVYRLNVASSPLSEEYCIEKKDKTYQYLLSAVIVFSLPLAISTGLNWVQFQSYRLVLGDMISLAYLGMFTAGYAISAGAFNAFESTAQQYFYPEFYKKIESSQNSSVNDAWTGYASVILPLSIFTGVVVIILAEPLTHLLLDKQYWASSQFVVLGVMVELGRVIGNVYGLACHGTKKTHKLILPQMFGALAVLLFVPVMINVIGKDGAIFSLVFASMLYVLMLHFTIKSHIGFRLSVKSLFRPYIKILPLLLLLLILAQVNYESIVYSLVVLAVGGVIYIASAYGIYKDKLLELEKNNI